jgi:hypothetical protein
MAGVNEKVDCFYTILNFLLDIFVPVRWIDFTEGDRLCSVCNLFGNQVMDLIYSETQICLVERKYDSFVSVNLDPCLT